MKYSLNPSRFFDLKNSICTNQKDSVQNNLLYYIILYKFLSDKYLLFPKQCDYSIDTNLLFENLLLTKDPQVLKDLVIENLTHLSVILKQYTKNSSLDKDLFDLNQHELNPQDIKDFIKALDSTTNFLVEYQSLYPDLNFRQMAYLQEKGIDCYQKVLKLHKPTYIGFVRKWSNFTKQDFYKLDNKDQDLQLLDQDNQRAVSYIAKGVLNTRQPKIFDYNCHYPLIWSNFKTNTLQRVEIHYPKDVKFNINPAALDLFCLVNGIVLTPLCSRVENSKDFDLVLMQTLENNNSRGADTIHIHKETFNQVLKNFIINSHVHTKSIILTNPNMDSSLSKETLAILTDHKILKAFLRLSDQSIKQQNNSEKEPRFLMLLDNSHDLQRSAYFYDARSILNTVDYCRNPDPHFREKLVVENLKKQQITLQTSRLVTYQMIKEKQYSLDLQEYLRVDSDYKIECISPYKQALKTLITPGVLPIALKDTAKLILPEHLGCNLDNCFLKDNILLDTALCPSKVYFEINQPVLLIDKSSTNFAFSFYSPTTSNVVICKDDIKGYLVISKKIEINYLLLQLSKAYFKDNFKALSQNTSEGPYYMMDFLNLEINYVTLFKNQKPSDQTLIWEKESQQLNEKNYNNPMKTITHNSK